MATYVDAATGGTYTTGAGGKTTGGSAKAGGGINPATGQYEGGNTNNNSVLNQQLSTMSLADAQSQADKAFSGLVAPMTLEEINAREEAAKGVTAEAATSIYDPQISREKQTGAAQVSTTKGVVGQRQGFNISTAEQAYVADVQNKVQDRIREVENIKASYISQGNLAAADRADTQIQSLNEWNSQMTIAKANYALQLMAGDREQAQLGLSQARLGLEEKAQEFNQGMANKNLALSIAGLTGEYEGSPTFAANQAEISNALAEANLTGYYNGQETLESATTKTQLALQERGVVINEKQLAETIRSNKVSEALSAARLNQEDEEVTASGFVDDAIKRLTNLRDSGNLSTVNYNAERKVIGETIGWDADSYGELESIINQAMEGNTAAQQILSAQADQNMGSDFYTAPNNSVVSNEDLFSDEFPKEKTVVGKLFDKYKDKQLSYSEAQKKYTEETGNSIFPKSEWKNYGYTGGII